ncbi:MAG: hypothetical protein NZM65_07935 [Flavobacteriales bacterium]|nr:hypothetical protein [Flavobacteriales bacterium]MDW8410602.1 hypothetical protein [Flavobacteriales bacterium]
MSSLSSKNSEGRPSLRKRVFPNNLLKGVPGVADRPNKSLVMPEKFFSDLEAHMLRIEN